MSEKKKYYLCPVTSMPHGDEVNIEDIKDVDQFEKEYEFVDVKYSPEVQENIDKGHLCLVEVDNASEDIEENSSVDFGNGKAAKLDASKANYTGNYAFISKAAFNVMFGNNAPSEEVQYVTKEVMQAINEFHKRIEEEKASKSE